MEEPALNTAKCNTQTNIFSNTEPSPKPEDLSFSSSASTVPPAQMPPATPVSWSSQLQKKKKTPTDHNNDKVEKYAKYFKDNEILPIPELVEAVEPKILSFVVKDQETCRPLKESFEEVLKTAGVLGRYFYWRSFATSPTPIWRHRKEAGHRRIKVTVCNMSMQLNGFVLAANLSSNGGVEDYTLTTSAHRTAYGDYAFTIMLDREGFHVIPHTIKYRDTTMMVVVEGKRLLCRSCKQQRRRPQRLLLLLLLLLFHLPSKRQRQQRPRKRLQHQ